MKTYTLARLLTKDQELPLEGTHLQQKPPLVLRQDHGNVTVYKPTGDPLLVYLPKAIPQDLCVTAYNVFSKVNTLADNRGMASGKGLTRPRETKKGYSSSKVVPKELAGISGVAGNFDRYTRIPYCRQTAFTAQNPKLWQSVLPYLRWVSDLFCAHMPTRWRAQKDVCDKTHKDWVIPGTVFTTLTINKNWQTACHYDAGDLAAGFGVMSALRAGSYEGCELVWPAFGVGCDMGTGDVCLADVHELHGNRPIVGASGTYRRVSVVFYYREKMQKCQSAVQEQERAKNRKPGDPLYD